MNMFFILFIWSFIFLAKIFIPTRCINTKNLLCQALAAFDVEVNILFLNIKARNVLGNVILTFNKLVVRIAIRKIVSVKFYIIIRRVLNEQYFTGSYRACIGEVVSLIVFVGAEIEFRGEHDVLLHTERAAQLKIAQYFYSLSI